MSWRVSWRHRWTQVIWALIRGKSLLQVLSEQRRKHGPLGYLGAGTAGLETARKRWEWMPTCFLGVFNTEKEQCF